MYDEGWFSYFHFLYRIKKLCSEACNGGSLIEKLKGNKVGKKKNKKNCPVLTNTLFVVVYICVVIHMGLILFRTLGLGQCGLVVY